MSCYIYSNLVLGSSKLSSLQLTYQSHGDEYTIVFSPSPSHSRKQSLDWLRGLKKVSQ